MSRDQSFAIGLDPWMLQTKRKHLCISGEGGDVSKARKKPKREIEGERERERGGERENMENGRKEIGAHTLSWVVEGARALCL